MGTGTPAPVDASPMLDHNELAVLAAVVANQLDAYISADMTKVRRQLGDMDDLAFLRALARLTEMQLVDSRCYLVRWRVWATASGWVTADGALS